MKKTLIILFFLVKMTISQAQTDTILLKKHLIFLTKEIGIRNFQNLKALNEAADYISATFKMYADTVYEQPYVVNGRTYKNIICSYGDKNAARIVVGAHYDVCGYQAGADDNGSGVAGLLELARQLKGQKLTQRIDLVAYTLEEPPFFKSKLMGSYVHAESLYKEKAAVIGMISIEMIGYFSEAKHSQKYPIPGLNLLYGNVGDFVILGTNVRKGKFARRFSHRFKKLNTIKVHPFTAPSWLPITDRSDNRCYWKFGYSALMINDTALYRNFEYHKPTDTMERLNLSKMAAVMNGVTQILINY
jgi:Peptidase family M28